MCKAANRQNPELQTREEEEGGRDEEQRDNSLVRGRQVSSCICVVYLKLYEGYYSETPDVWIIRQFV